MRYQKLRSILRLFPMALPWHRNISVAAVLLLLVGRVVACGPGHSSHLVDLGTGEHTNIGSSLGGTVVPASDLVAIHVLPNTNVPKGVVVSLYDSPAGSNVAFVKELYQIIEEINRTGALIPTRHLSNPTKLELGRQEITLLLLVAQGRMSEFERFKSRLMAERRGVEPNGLIAVESDHPHTDLWLQDFGEFAKAELRGATEPVYLLLDIKRNDYRGEFSPEVFMRLFRMPLVQLGDDGNLFGQYGGNIDATPSGRLIMGDAVRQGRKNPELPSLFDRLRALGNPDALELESDWLSIGHIDEYLTFTSSVLGCGETIYYGRPLEGLRVVLDKASDEEFAKFAKEAAVESGISFTRGRLKAALQSFRRNDRNGNGNGRNVGPEISIDLADYDLTRHDPVWTLLDDEQGLSIGVFDTLKWSDPDSLVRYYVWRNLLDQEIISRSVSKLLATADCQQSEGLPVIYRPNFKDKPKIHSPNERVVVHVGDTAHLPGVTNSLVLRDHVIVPDPGIQALRDLTSERFGRHLGGATSQVHFIDDRQYHKKWGEVHCGTNVIREMDLPFRAATR